jgi:hypothetical protein
VRGGRAIPSQATGATAVAAIAVGALAVKAAAFGALGGGNRGDMGDLSGPRACSGGGRATT